MKSQPFVSIIIPCLDEEATIGDCLRSVLRQTYPRERTEIIVADGGSRDGTVSIVESVARLFPLARIRIVHNLDRIQSAGCNHAIRLSRGDVILRMDAHAGYARDYVERCVEVLRATGADNVGGAARPCHRTFFQRAVSAVLESPLGIGGASYRRADGEGWVDTIWPGAFQRSVFEKVGLFDARATTNEDAELNLRLARAGGRIYQSRDIVAHYFPRDSLLGVARQYLRYGLGRARTTLKHRRLQSWRPLAPFALVVTLLALGAASPFSGLARTAFALALEGYLCAVAVESARVSLRRGIELLPFAFALIPTIHLSHGLGFAAGLVRYLGAPDWSPEPERLAPRAHAR